MLTGLLVVCALTTTGLMVRRELLPPPDPNAPRPPVEVKNWQEYAVGRKTDGRADAPVTIVEFSDFQCPFCAAFAKTLKTARARYPDSVRLVYRNFPLTAIHPVAKPAALAAECAAQQGQFIRYHDVLFERQDSLPSLDWQGTARAVGITDTAAFRGCRSGSVAAAAVKADSLAGVALHVNGTPTVMVNRWLLVGAPTPAVLDSLIGIELAKARNR